MIPQIPLFNTGKWKLDAKCADPAIDPELFDIATIKKRFRGRVTEHGVEAISRELCQGCPVIQQCAAYALEQTKTCAGLVYAGTPTWPRSGSSTAPRDDVIEALMLITDGMDVEQAHKQAFPETDKDNEQT